MKNKINYKRKWKGIILILLLMHPFYYSNAQSNSKIKPMYVSIEEIDSSLQEILNQRVVLTNEFSKISRDSLNYSEDSLKKEKASIMNRWKELKRIESECFYQKIEYDKRYEMDELIDSINLNKIKRKSIESSILHDTLATGYWILNNQGIERLRLQQVASYYSYLTIHIKNEMDRKKDMDQKPMQFAESELDKSLDPFKSFLDTLGVKYSRNLYNICKEGLNNYMSALSSKSRNMITKTDTISSEQKKSYNKQFKIYQSSREIAQSYLAYIESHYLSSDYSSTLSYKEIVVQEKLKKINDSLNLYREPFDPERIKIENYKSWWAVYDKMALSLAPYNTLEADYNPNGPNGLNGKYSISIPSFIMPLVKYRNNENFSEDYKQAVNSQKLKTVFSLPYNYYLTLSTSNENGLPYGYMLTTGTFINQSRYREDRDAFIALIDVNEKDFTKKVKMMLPMGFNDESGQEFNDFGIKSFTGNDGSIFWITASVPYEKKLSHSDYGESAVFRIHKIDQSGKLLYSKILNINSKLRNEVNLIPILKIFEDAKHKDNIDIIYKSELRKNEGDVSSNPSNTNYVINYCRIDQNGAVSKMGNTFDGDFQLMTSNQLGHYSYDSFHSFGGAAQDENGNNYLLLNFNKEVFYRVGTPWAQIKQLLDIEKRSCDSKLKTVTDFNRKMIIQAESSKKQIEIISSNTNSSETFTTKAISQDISMPYIKSNYILMKFDSNYELIYCKAFLSDEPRIIDTLQIDNKAGKLLLDGKRSNYLNVPLHVEVNLDGVELSNNGLH